MEIVCMHMCIWQYVAQYGKKNQMLLGRLGYITYGIHCIFPQQKFWRIPCNRKHCFHLFLLPSVASFPCILVCAVLHDKTLLKRCPYLYCKVTSSQLYRQPWKACNKVRIPKLDRWQCDFADRGEVARHIWKGTGQLGFQTGADIFGSRIRRVVNVQIYPGFSNKSIDRIVHYHEFFAMSQIKELETAGEKYIYSHPLALTSGFAPNAHNFCSMERTIFHTVMVCHPRIPILQIVNYVKRAINFSKKTTHAQKAVQC